MTSIDDIIARSRQPGEFQERRHFSIARGRAIQKLRKFALVDPHYYILELIQSAIANGATYIDIDCQRTTSAISYTGGHFPQNAMAQLFDFLFTSEDDVEHGPLRQMALGVNALMRFKPDLIVIETGDGTLQGTTRVEIRGDDAVDVGTPDQALNGTYLRATGLSRLKIGFDSSLQRINGHRREYTAIENRCLVAPVPILYNQEPIFGYTAQRIPESLFGFRRTVEFDEGDLYGVIGRARRKAQSHFRLMTHGVWIESKKRSFELPNGDTLKRIGGVITFEGLRKTADHGAIVEDDRYEQMWLRLRPYINELLGHVRTEGRLKVRDLDGQPLENPDILAIINQSPRVLLFRRHHLANERTLERARAIAHSLGDPALSVAQDSFEDVLTLAGRDIDVIRPDLDDDALFDFYTQAEAPPPPRPWLTSPVELGAMNLLSLMEALPQDRIVPPDILTGRQDYPDWVFRPDGEHPTLRKAIFFTGRRPDDDQSASDYTERHITRLGDLVRATVFTPAQQGQAASSDHNVEVRSRRRVVWRGHVDAVAPGQVLIIDVTGLSPQFLWSHTPQSPHRCRAALLADAVVQLHLTRIERAADQALRGALRADIEPGSSGARLVLSTLSRRLVKRIRRIDGRRRIDFSLIDPELDPQILERPLLCPVEGPPLSLADLPALMDNNHGLLYALRADIDADLQDLDTSQILVVDQALEDILISLVGPTAYIRVDERDRVAQYDDFQCRDIALGLRDYPDWPLLVEGDDPSALPPVEQIRVLRALLKQIVDVATAPGVDAESQELRRHAWRHLQYFVHRAPDFPDLQDVEPDLFDFLPLYATADGHTLSHELLQQALESDMTLEMIDGRAIGAGEHPFKEAKSRQLRELPAGSSLSLAMNPFVLHLLGDAVRGAAEYAISRQELQALDTHGLDQELLLESQSLADDQLRGLIAIPLEPPPRPGLLVFSADDAPTRFYPELGRQFGVVGKLQLRPDVDHEEVDAALHSASHRLLTHLLARLPQLGDDPDRVPYERALELLLRYAGAHLQLSSGFDGTLRHHVDDHLAEQILHTPLFPSTSGLPRTPMAIVQDFQHRAARHLDDPSWRFEPRDVGQLSPVLQRWIDDHLQHSAIHHQRPAPSPNADEASAQTEGQRCLAATLQHWILRLHPAPNLHPDRDFQVIMTASPFESKELRGHFCQLAGHGELQTLRINPQHWLTRWVLRSGDHSPQPLAWAILSSYAHINNMLEQVTNHQELICQQQLLNALDRGELTLLTSAQKKS